MPDLNDQERERLAPEQIVRETAAEYARDLRQKTRRKFTEDRTTGEIAAFERSAQRIEDALCVLDAREEPRGEPVEAAIEAVAEAAYLILPPQDQLLPWEKMGKSSKDSWRAKAREFYALFAALATRKDTELADRHPVLAEIADRFGGESKPDLDRQEREALKRIAAISNTRSTPEWDQVTAIALAALAAREEPASYDPGQDKRPYNELSSTQQIARERASFLRQLNAVDKELMWKGSGRGRVESIQRLKAAREDTERPAANDIPKVNRTLGGAIGDPTPSLDTERPGSSWERHGDYDG